MRNSNITAVFFNRDESYCFVKRSVGVKLNLRMLIRNAERFYRSLSESQNLSVLHELFAQRFRPKLRIPIRHEFQRIRIGHQHADVCAVLFRRNDFKQGKHQSGVPFHIGV